MPALAPSEIGTAWKPPDMSKRRAWAALLISIAFLEYRFEQARFQEARVIVQLRRVVCKSKFYTSQAVIRGTRPLAHPVRTA
jgi:hypothetical protein